MSTRSGYSGGVPVYERAALVAMAITVIALLVVVTIRSYRRGGYGTTPRVWPQSRAARTRVNDSWERHGWAKPFDEHGNLIPRPERKLPEDE